MNDVPTLQVAALPPLFIQPELWRIHAPASELDCAKLIDVCRKQDATMRKALRARSGQSRSELRKAVRYYCTADCAKVASLAYELNKAGVQIGKSKTWSFRAVVEAACSIRWDGPVIGKVIVEPLSLELKTKAVFKFCDPRERARHRLAHNALSAALRLPSWAFLFNGGEGAAIDWLRKRLPAAKTALVTDFPSCFAVLPWQVVENGSLLSKGACRSLLFDPWKRAKVMWPGPEKPSLGAAFLRDALSISNCAHEIGAGRGIPPGAALSPIVAQCVLRDLLTEELLATFAGIEIGLFADNLVILLDDDELAAPVRDRLTLLAYKHFDSIVAHEFRERTDVLKLGDSFRLLGRDVKWRKRVSFSPPLSHCSRVVEKVQLDALEGDFERALRRAAGFNSRHAGSKLTAMTLMQIGHRLAEQAATMESGHHMLDELLTPSLECN